MVIDELATELANKQLIGVAEYVSLPKLNLQKIAARIDTGAQTSALHVDHIEANEDSTTVSFWFHPDFHDVDKTIKCSAPIHDIRLVKSSNGEKQKRFVILTQAQLGDFEWDIELTLTDRSSMQHLMLLGREALAPAFVIDPEQNFVKGD